MKILMTSGCILFLTVFAGCGAMSELIPPPLSTVISTPAPTTLTTPTKYCFVGSYGNFGAGDIKTYDVNATTGALTYAGQITSTTGVRAMVIDPVTHSYLYAIVNTNLTSYSINSTTGALTLIDSRPVPSFSMYGLAIAPSGKYVYVPASTDIYIFPVASGLIAVHSTFTDNANFTGAENLAIHPSGNYIYIADFNTPGKIAQYNLNSTTGQIGSSLTPATVSSGNQPISLAITSNGNYAFVNNQVGTISAYTISANGTLSPSSTVPAASNGVLISVDPTDTHVYELDLSSNLYAFSASASLPAVASSPSVLDGPTATTMMAWHSSGLFAFVTDYAAASGTSVHVYSRNPATGALTSVPASSVSGLDKAYGIACY